MALKLSGLKQFRSLSHGSLVSGPIRVVSLGVSHGVQPDVGLASSHLEGWLGWTSRYLDRLAAVDVDRQLGV